MDHKVIDYTFVSHKVWDRNSKVVRYYAIYMYSVVTYSYLFSPHFRLRYFWENGLKVSTFQRTKTNNNKNNQNNNNKKKQEDKTNFKNHKTYHDKIYLHQCSVTKRCFLINLETKHDGVVVTYGKYGAWNIGYMKHINIDFILYFIYM